MVSLKTIAERCGVSTATVSKALNDHKDISEETKNRVKQTAEALGYFPNAAARALKTNRSYNIGVLFEEEAGRGLTHEYFSGVLNGLKIQAEKLGYDITFINTCFENRKMSYYEHCRYRNFEGVVIVCANFDDPDVIELMNSEIPVVTIDYVHHNCTAVTSNNIQGMEDLVKYIYSQGHRKIAYIHTPSLWEFRCARSLGEGVKEGLREISFFMGYPQNTGPTSLRICAAPSRTVGTIYGQHWPDRPQKRHRKAYSP